MSVVDVVNDTFSSLFEGYINQEKNSKKLGFVGVYGVDFLDNSELKDRLLNQIKIFIRSWT